MHEERIGYPKRVYTQEGNRTKCVGVEECRIDVAPFEEGIQQIGRKACSGKLIANVLQLETGPCYSPPHQVLQLRVLPQQLRDLGRAHTSQQLGQILSTGRHAVRHHHRECHQQGPKQPS